MPPLDPERIREQSARLHRLAAAIVGDSLADDVVQDVWVAALDGPAHEPRSVAAWLSRVTRNLAWRRRIGDSRRRAREEHASSSEGSEALDEIVARIEEGHLIERALLELDEPYRSTLLWRYYDELSITEVSRRSGCTESTTRTHLQRGLERLRERLKSEHGPDWRLALLPFLRADRVPPVAAGTLSAVLGGALVTTLTKSILIAAALLSGWMLFDRFGGADEAPPPPLEPAAAPSAATPDASPSPVEVTASPGRQVAREDVPVEAADVAVETAPSPVTPARVVDPRCGTGIPGLRLRVDRGDDSYELTTDDEGNVELPFAMTPKERSASRPPFRAEALVSGSREQVLKLDVNPREDLDPLELRLSSAWTTRVRLPESVGDAALEALSATASLHLDNGGTVNHVDRYAPILRRGRDLLFVVPKPIGLDHVPARITTRTLRMSIDSRRSYSATLPPEVSLADPPTLAKEVELVAQQVLVRSDLTRLPVFGAFVSLREPGRPNHAPVELASGHTDKYGKVTFPMVRPGGALAVVNRQGFELTSHEVEVVGGNSTLELDLHEVAGKSDLAVTVRLARGPVPEYIAIWVYEGPMQQIGGSEFLVPRSDGAEGWTAEARFEGLPPGKCRIEVSSDLPGLGTPEPYLVELPREHVVIELATPPLSRPLQIELPDGVRTIDFWLEARGHLRLVSRGAADGAQLAQVTEERRPRCWLVASEGYVPVFGREDAWRRGDADGGDPVFILSPELEPGSGVVVRVSFDRAPLAGAELKDPETGVVLATTDDRGFALVRGARPGDLLQVTGDGCQPRELRIDERPLATCQLRKR